MFNRFLNTIENEDLKFLLEHNRRPNFYFKLLDNTIILHLNGWNSVNISVQAHNNSFP